MRRNSAQLTSILSGLAAALTIQTVVYSEKPAYAHGATIEVLPQAIEIVATFDTGEPMADAQVSIYAPDELETPSQTGQTDSEGRFLFTPEADAVPGNWEVTVRKAGHGQTTTFAMGAIGEEGAGVFAGASGQGMMGAQATQRWISMAAILWGFLGTALYFSRKGSQNKDIRLALYNPDSDVKNRDKGERHKADGYESDTVITGAGSDRKETH